MDASSEYLTDAQFCGMANVTPRTSNQWRRDGQGPTYYRVGPRRILYKRSNVETWLASRRFCHRAGEIMEKAAA